MFKLKSSQPVIFGCKSYFIELKRLDSLPGRYIRFLPRSTYTPVTHMNNLASWRQKQESNAKGRSDRKLVFSGLYDKYAPSLLGVLTKLVGDKEEAWTLLEASFLAIHTKLLHANAIKPPVFVGLLHIARQTALDALKTRRQLTGTGLQLTKSGIVQTTPPQTSVSTVIKPTSSNAAQLALLDSVMFDNYTPEEAAANLGIPTELARHQLRLAIQELRSSPTN